jgi:hypothetical protein
MADAPACDVDQLDIRSPQPKIERTNMPLVARTRAVAAGRFVERLMTVREDVAGGMGGTQAMG